MGDDKAEKDAFEFANLDPGLKLDKNRVSQIMSNMNKMPWEYEKDTSRGGDPQDNPEGLVDMNNFHADLKQLNTRVNHMKDVVNFQKNQ